MNDIHIPAFTIRKEIVVGIIFFVAGALLFSAFSTIATTIGTNVSVTGHLFATSTVQATGNIVGYADLIMGTTTPWKGASFVFEQRAGTPPVFLVGDTGTSTPHFVISPKGYVGIGTASPGAFLDVAGNVRIGTTGNTTVYKVATGDLYFGTNPVGDYDLRLVAGGATRILLDGNTGNVGIGTTTPNANAILDVTSTTKAFMPPRMTTTQRDAIASPTAGMVIYNSSTNKLNVYTTTWEAVTSS